jgi:hypothetical protein
MSHIVYFKDRGKNKKPRYWRVVMESWTRFYNEYSNERSRGWKRL